jgi:hypothetical protein
MKFLLAILTLSLVGCGISNDVANNCGGELKPLCHAIFGPGDKELTGRVEDIEERELEVQTQLDSILSSINALEIALSQLEIDVNASEDALTVITNQITILEDDATQLQVELVEIQGETRVTELLDPCGDHPNNFDEVLLRTSNGDLVAYFEVGSKRFLSVLSRGQSYATTDQQACNFSVNSLGQLCDNLGCR